MSTLKYVGHTVCISCRESKCDTEHRCNECEDGGGGEDGRSLKHNKFGIETRKSKSSTSELCASSSSSSVPPTCAVSRIKDSKVESRSVDPFKDESGNLSDMI